MKKIGIYVHIPFCKSKCKYCNFTSYVGCENLMDSYIKSVVDELEQWSKKCTDVTIDTIYIGGGTPSMLTTGGVATILDAIKTNFNVEPSAEISIESNPNSINYAKAQEWLDSGVNRVSVGLQSVKQSLLNVMGRSHTKADFVKAIECLQAVGFKNINADIMIGIPKQKLSDVKQTLYTIQKLGLTHISCYSLILEKDTPMNKLILQGVIKEPKEEKTINMYSFVHKFLAKLGYNRYEVSNFAISNYECKHNINTWNLHEYLGVGVSAHGYFNGERYSNELNIENYISKIADHGNAIVSTEKVLSENVIEEYIMLGLRLKQGIDIDYLKNELNYDILNVKSAEINKLKNLELIDINNGRLFATDKGFYVLNAIIIDLV